jgi:hypothetical protein
VSGQPDSIIPGSSQQPQCAACGFLVEKKGQLCAACQEKVDARGPRGSELLRPMHAAVAPKDGPRRDFDPDAEDEAEGEVDE